MVIKKEKLRCGICIFLNDCCLPKQAGPCSTLGKNRGNPACKKIEIDFEHIPAAMCTFLASCNDRDLLILDKLVERQVALINKGKSSLRLGSEVFYKVGEYIHKVFIENITTEHITGRDKETGIIFTLSHSTKLYKTEEELRADQHKFKKIQNQIQKDTKQKDTELYPKTGWAPDSKKNTPLIPEFEEA